MPRRETRAVSRDRNAKQTRKIDTAERRNVGKGERVASDEVPSLQLLVQPAHGLFNARFVRLAPFFIAIAIRLAQTVSGVMEKGRGRPDQAFFDPPLPHRDQSLVFRCFAKQRRLRLRSLEVTGNRNSLRYDRAVVELEAGYGFERIELGEVLTVLLAFEDIDLGAVDIDPLLS